MSSDPTHLSPVSSYDTSPFTPTSSNTNHKKSASLDNLKFIAGRLNSEEQALNSNAQQQKQRQKQHDKQKKKTQEEKDDDDDEKAEENTKVFKTALLQSVSDSKAKQPSPIKQWIFKNQAISTV